MKRIIFAAVITMFTLIAHAQPYVTGSVSLGSVEQMNIGVGYQATKRFAFELNHLSVQRTERGSEAVRAGVAASVVARMPIAQRVAVLLKGTAAKVRQEVQPFGSINGIGATVTEPKATGWVAGGGVGLAFQLNKDVNITAMLEGFEDLNGRGGSSTALLGFQAKF
jgi:hypothetical protein